MRFYCPRCWRDFPQKVQTCPNCGLEVEEFWHSKDYVEKLIIALKHPEKETPIRAAWLLGQLKDQRAVQPLIEIIEQTDDVYLAREAVRALGEIHTPEACRFLGSLIRHPAKMVREEVQRILSRPNGVCPSSKENQGSHGR